jgi:hypothetical protein
VEVSQKHYLNGNKRNQFDLDSECKKDFNLGDQIVRSGLQLRKQRWKYEAWKNKVAGHEW